MSEPKKMIHRLPTELAYDIGYKDGVEDERQRCIDIAERLGGIYGDLIAEKIRTVPDEQQ